MSSTAAQEKIVQYLGEAHAGERALTRVLQAQIAMTPRGTYRTALDTHLGETRDHAERVGRRLKELRGRRNPVAAVVGLTETVVGQELALGRTPLDLARGQSGEEKVLKNAKDACATEALEIATYTAIERLARSVGDRQTATLAASIRGDEERMLERIMRAIPTLTDAVAGAEGRVKGVVATEGDLALAQYDSLTADEITSRLPGLSQIDLAKIDAYERRNEKRTTVLSRITSLRGDEPWPGYDELTAAEVQAYLANAGDDELDTRVRTYERTHKDRAGVLRATEREHSTA